MAAFVGVACFVGSRCPPAGAQPRDPAAAEVLFNAGRAALERGDLATACPKFAESQRLDPAPGTLLNLATCEERAGKLASAWQHFREAAAEIGEKDERGAFAVQRAKALDRRVPRLVVRLAPHAPRSTVVQRDRVQLGNASLGIPLPVDPGKHVVEASSPGRIATHAELTLAEGETREVVVAPGASIPGQPTTGERGAAAEPEPPSGGSTRRTLGFVAAGVGMAALGVAGITSAMLVSRRDTVRAHCDENRVCDGEGLDAAESGRTLVPINTVSWAVGVAGVGAGAWLLLSAGGGPSATGAGGAKAGAGGAGLLIGGRF